MRSVFLVACAAALIALCRSASEPEVFKLPTKLTATSSDDKFTGNTKDLDASASDRTFHVGREYGQTGIYAGGIPYGSYAGAGNSLIYPPGSYRGSSPGYRGFQVGASGGIIGGGNTGYGYYGNSGYGPNYGYSGYGGYGTGYGTGYGGYGTGYGTTYGTGYGTGYGAGYGTGYGTGYGGYGSGYGLTGIDDGYLGYGRGGYGRYGGNGLDGNYASGYGGYGSTYGGRVGYDPYGYRGNSYGNYAGYPSGYRGYS